MREHPSARGLTSRFHSMEASVESAQQSTKITAPAPAGRTTAGGLIRRGGNMQSFWTGTIAAIIIAVVAGFALNATNMTAGEKYSTSNVRLN